MIPITTEDAPAPAGPYSQAVISGGFIFTSGQIPVEPGTGKTPDRIEDQIKLVLNNLFSIISAGGSVPANIVSVTIYLTDMENFQIMNSIYAEFFKSPYPARICIGVNSLPKGAKIMADAIGRIE